MKKRKHYVANRAAICAKRREYCAANREKIAAYYAANREKIAAYYAANREKLCEKRRAQYAWRTEWARLASIEV